MVGAGVFRKFSRIRGLRIHLDERTVFGYGHRLETVTEKQPYRLVKQFDDFELRHYPEHAVVEVTTHGDFMTAGSIGFRPLLSYISGFNLKAQKFAMTAPVLQQESYEDVYVISFVLPAGAELTDLPQPKDGGVTAKVVAARYVAARRFGGGWQEGRFMGEGEKLLSAVEAAGLHPVDEVFWARFDPPWKPGFLKHNEALIALEGVTE